MTKIEMLKDSIAEADSTRLDMLAEEADGKSIHQVTMLIVNLERQLAAEEAKAAK